MSAMKITQFQQEKREMVRPYSCEGSEVIKSVFGTTLRFFLYTLRCKPLLTPVYFSFLTFF